MQWEAGVDERRRPEQLGLSVRADGVRLGTVGAVWVDARDEVLGMEVRSALSVLRAGPTAFFAEQDARRIANEAVGLATAVFG